MENDREEKIKAWQETQTQWDDTDFLAQEATFMMKKKWKRLNSMILAIIGKEVVAGNEYVNLLDIGAGRGDFYRLSQGLIKKYTGIEPSEKMLINEINGDEFILKRGTGETMDEPPCYNVCLLKEVLDHTYEPGKVISNCWKALTNNGILIISMTNRDAFYKLIFKKRAKQLEVEHKDHLYNFNPKEVRDLMEKAGFTVEEVRSINYLRLPKFIENIVGRLPDRLIFWKLNVIDALMSKFLPEKGGGFIITARKIIKGEQ
jgi:2-polyprenyl-3-methyl-5-hydroxy-6-metoxy-1,4-benzoquinol methylase